MDFIRNNKYIIIGILVILLVVMLGINISRFLKSDLDNDKPYYENFGKYDDTINSNDGNADLVKLSKNIKSYGELAKNGMLIVFVTNDNNIALDMIVEVEFYDEKGTILGSQKEYLDGVGAKRDVALEMYDTPSKFDNYKIYVDVERTDYATYYDKLQISNNNTGKNIVLQVKNNSQDEIQSIEVAVVYYNDGKVVGFDDNIAFDIKSGRSANFNFYYPKDKNYKIVQFDDYKIFVNEATTYNY